VGGKHGDAIVLGELKSRHASSCPFSVENQMLSICNRSKSHYAGAPIRDPVVLKFKSSIQSRLYSLP
jgi:hypothetical protein